MLAVSFFYKTIPQTSYAGFSKNIPAGRKKAHATKSNTGFIPHLTRYLACPEGFEPPTYWFVASHSIQLSYGHIFVYSVVLTTIYIISQLSRLVNPFFQIFQIFLKNTSKHIRACAKQHYPDAFCGRAATASTF